MATPARVCAYTVVRRVFERGAYTDRVFRAEADRLKLAGRDRAFAMRVAYGVVQRRATLDYLITGFTRRPLDALDPPVLAALRTGMYELVFSDVPDHAAVGENVELAKRAGGRGFALVNAVLRRAAREGHTALELIGERTPREAALRDSHPVWIAELWWEQLGAEAAVALMRADNEPAESAVRVNTLRADRDETLRELEREGVAAVPGTLAPEAIVFDDPYDIHGSELFARGAVMPQSRASMLVAHAIEPQPGQRLLDLCAAPGAKTTHLAALMCDDGAVLAVELDAHRARDIERNATRLGASCVEVAVGDAAEPAYGSGFDGVLVDPPCSDLGTLQSRPDARWRKTPQTVEELAELQARILDAGAQALRPGGRLVYSTCTIDPAENEHQVDAFLHRHPEFEIAAPPSPLAGVSTADRRFVQTLPHRDRTDGFFIAAFERHE